MSRTTRRRITVPAPLMGGLSYLMLGGGARTLLVPFLWFGALARWRTTWHRSVRATLAALAAANIVAVVGLTVNEDGLDRLRSSPQPMPPLSGTLGQRSDLNARHLYARCDLQVMSTLGLDVQYRGKS